MNAAATGVLKELPDVVLAYGISDEYRSASSPRNLAGMHHGLISLVALSSIDLLNYSIDGRGNMSGTHSITNSDGLMLATSKILTTVVSTFTSYYVHLWPSFFHDRALSSPMPSFDGRVVQYPSIQNVRDYLSWRQADCKLPLWVCCAS